jgi:hypothetical protein
MADVTREIKLIVDSKGAIKSIEGLNQALDQNQKEVKQTSKETDKYSKVLEDTRKRNEVFTGFLDKMTGGLFSTVKATIQSTKAFKGLNAVLKASPIGLIVAAVGALVAAFRRLQGPADRVGQLFRGLESVMNTILDRVALLGNAIIKVFSGDFKGAVEDAKSAFNDLGTAITESFERGNEIAEQSQQLEKAESDVALAIAKRRLEIEKLIFISRDQTKTEQERLDAVKAASVLERQNIADLNRLNEQKLELARQEFEDSSKLRADEIALQEAQIQALQVEQQNRAKLRELKNRETEATNALNRAIDAQNKLQTDSTQIYRELSDSLTEYIDLQELLNEELFNQIDIENELAAIKVSSAETSNDVTKEATKTAEGLADGYQIATQAASGLLDALQGKKSGKDIFKSILKTAGSILSLIPGVGTFASGIPGLISGIFADGGIIKGPSHSSGGVIIEAEGGEAVINKRSMDIPGVKEIASYLNELGGGLKFADGGIVPTQTATEQQLAQIQQSLLQERIVLPIPDFRTELTKVISIEEKANL